MPAFSGSYTAIATPWTADGAGIDWKSLNALIDRQMEGGTDGIVPAGSTGEAATLTHAEQGELVAKTVERVAGRARVFAGAGSNSTAEAIGLARQAHQAGADGLMVITPYYNRPTPEGLYRHFMAIAEATPLPIMLYNIPSRTGTNMLPATVARLRAACDRFAAIKEGSGNVEQAAQIIDESDILVFSGDDSLALPMMSLGAVGVVSVAGNIFPALVKSLTASALSGDFAAARKMHYRLMPLVRALFLETNPGPLKKALFMFGIGNGVLRPPLAPPGPAVEKALGMAIFEEVLPAM